MFLCKNITFKYIYIEQINQKNRLYSCLFNFKRDGVPSFGLLNIKKRCYLVDQILHIFYCRYIVSKCTCIYLIMYVSLLYDFLPYAVCFWTSHNKKNILTIQKSKHILKKYSFLILY